MPRLPVALAGARGHRRPRPLTSLDGHVWGG